MIEARYKINLQFFGKAENEGRTEKATQKKRDDARNKGQVAKSTELNTAVMIVGFCAMTKLLGSYMMFAMKEYMTGSFTRLADILKEPNASYLLSVMGSAIMSLGKIIIPLILSLGIIAFLITYKQVGWKFTTQPMKPNFGKMNPINGLKKIGSKDTLIHLLLAVGKVTVLGAVVYNIIQSKILVYSEFYDMEVEQIFKLFCNGVLQLGFYVGGAFLILAVLDYVYQHYKHEESLKMTKQEVKDEYKNAEGDPQIKGKIKQKMREASMRRMMQAVPEADVVITNPTHFAVAIKYDADKGTAPVVVAKGVDYVAKKIKEKAKESNIQIVENKPLARALYYTVDLDKEIPPELYSAVAEVLAFVYKLENRTTDGRRKG